MKRKIVFFTGARAEYGLLRSIIRNVAESGEADVTLLASGTHLSGAYGNTIEEIEKDSFAPLVKIPIALEQNEPEDIAAATGKGLEAYATFLARHHPDLLVVLGDRYETFAAATAAAICGVPIAHIYGGEITEGAIDDVLRHSITKMSHLHFTSCEKYRQRVLQMGEDPSHVWTAGSLGLENSRNIPYLAKDEVLEFLNLPKDSDYVVATWHPVTLSDNTGVTEVRELLSALRQFPNLCFVFTGSNADAGGKQINEFLQAESEKDPNLKFFMSLGVCRYMQAIRHSRGVIGNSSSGLCEIPGMGIPVLDIGDRQKGRERAECVWHCERGTKNIKNGLDKIFSPDFKNIAKNAVNPFDKPGTAHFIARHLLEFPLENLRRKHFYENF